MAYLYTHAVNEFVRNKPLTTPEIYPARTDSALLRWLLESRQSEGSSGAASPGESQESGSASAAFSPQPTGSGLGDPMDRWERRAAVAAYALTVGSLPSTPQGATAEEGAPTSEAEGPASELFALSLWFEESLAKWIRSERRAQDWCEVKEAMIAKVEWLLVEGPGQDALLWELALMRMP